MATRELTGTPLRADDRASKLDALDAAARAAASHVRTTPATPKPARKVVERFSASHPRGSWPAEEYAQGLRRDGRNVDVVMDIKTDTFLVIEPAA